MGDIFLKTLDTSITASWLILAVILLRFILKKTPKWIAVLLWGIVALQLVIPFSFESALSLIPSAKTFNAHNIPYETPAVNRSFHPVFGETFAPDPEDSVNSFYVCTFIIPLIWITGIAAMLLYAVINYVRVRHSVAERVPYKENIFLCDHVKSPFILGLVRPKIYLPSHIDVRAIFPVHIAKDGGILINSPHILPGTAWTARRITISNLTKPTIQMVTAAAALPIG